MLAPRQPHLAPRKLQAFSSKASTKIFSLKMPQEFAKDEKQFCPN
jgi:hypothetical protein